MTLRNILIRFWDWDPQEPEDNIYLRSWDWDPQEPEDNIYFGCALFAPLFTNRKREESRNDAARYDFCKVLRDNFKFLANDDKSCRSQVQNIMKTFYEQEAYEKNKKNLRNWMSGENKPSAVALIDLLSALCARQTDGMSWADKVKFVKKVIADVLDRVSCENEEEGFSKLYMRDLDNVAYVFTVLHGGKKDDYQKLNKELECALKETRKSALESRTTNLQRKKDNFKSELGFFINDKTGVIKDAIQDELNKMEPFSGGRYFDKRLNAWQELSVDYLSTDHLSDDEVYNGILSEAKREFDNGSELTCDEILAQCVLSAIWEKEDNKSKKAKLCDDIQEIAGTEISEQDTTKINEIIQTSYNEVYLKAVTQAIQSTLGSVTENKTITSRYVEGQIEQQEIMGNEGNLREFISSADPDWFMVKGHRSKIKECIKMIKGIETRNNLEPVAGLSEKGDNESLREKMLCQMDGIFQFDTENVDETLEDNKWNSFVCKNFIDIKRKNEISKIKFNRKTLSFRTILLFFAAEEALASVLDKDRFDARNLKKAISVSLQGCGFVPLGALRGSAADQYVEMVVDAAAEAVRTEEKDIERG